MFLTQRERKSITERAKSIVKIKKKKKAMITSMKRKKSPREKKNKESKMSTKETLTLSPKIPRFHLNPRKTNSRKSHRWMSIKPNKKRSGKGFKKSEMKLKKLGLKSLRLQRDLLKDKDLHMMNSKKRSRKSRNLDKNFEI